MPSYRRRRFIETLLTVAAAAPIAPLRLWAQSNIFPGPHKAALRALAGAVLPQSLGSEGLDQITVNFIRWVHGYKPGADMEHGYGFTRMTKTGPSPAAAYTNQLAGMAGLSSNALREKVTAEFAAAKINSLPQTPDGRHVAADLMAYWFRSADANDFCYGVAIRRDDCRGFATASDKPGPLKGKQA